MSACTQVQLVGSSWDHPRGHAPMVATAAAYQRATDAVVAIEWRPRSLRRFGTDVVEHLARDYDLVLVDHPHVGTAAEASCIVPLDEHLDDATMQSLREGSPGHSYESYVYGGHLWALPVDAACQVCCWREDLLDEVPGTWEEVLALAASGRVLWPLCDVDAAASFLSLAALAGHPCAGDTEAGFVDRAVGRWVLELMRTVAGTSDPRCLTANPIAALDALASTDDFAYAPLLFGYVNYSRVDAMGRRLRFGDVPAVGGSRAGALLGGVGLAVSRRCAAPDVAIDYARFVAAPETQRGIYFHAGGQPAHAAAWSDPEVDRMAGGFFSATGATMRSAWTRPRYPRFAAFQTEMMELFAGFATSARSADALLDELDMRYERSQAKV